MARFGRVCGVGGCPTVTAGVVPSAGIKRLAVIVVTPDNHFSAGPKLLLVSGSGGMMSVVAVHVSSVQPSEGLPITGSVHATCANIVAVDSVSSSAVRRSGGAQFGVGSTNRRSSALLILVWPNTPR